MRIAQWFIAHATVSHIIFSQDHRHLHMYIYYMYIIYLLHENIHLHMLTCKV